MTTDAATETLDTATEATEPPEAGTSAAPDQPTDAAPPKWRDIAGRLSDGLDDEPDTDRDDDADDEQAAAQAKPEGETTPTAASPAKGEAPAADEQPTGERPRPPRFEVVDAEGKTTELKLPDGAKVVFKADGKQVEVESLDELVRFAQQGVPAQAIRTELGTVQRQLATMTTERDDYAGRVDTAEQRADAAEDLAAA